MVREWEGEQGRPRRGRWEEGAAGGAWPRVGVVVWAWSRVGVAMGRIARKGEWWA